GSGRCRGAGSSSMMPAKISVERCGLPEWRVGMPEFETSRRSSPPSRPKVPGKGAHAETAEHPETKTPRDGLAPGAVPHHDPPPETHPGSRITARPRTPSSPLRSLWSLRWSLFRTALQVVSSEGSPEFRQDL